LRQLFQRRANAVAAMKHRHRHRTLRFLGSTAILGILLAGSGCASRVYRADALPPDLVAPPALDLETVNLSGLTDRSVSAEVIQTGDVLDVTMVNDFTTLKTTTTPVRVAEDGSVLVPLVGPMVVGGMEVEQAEKLVNSESISRGIFRTPCINLAMKQCRLRTVTVLGAVNKPGSHELPRGSTSLMAAIVAAEGLSKDAGTAIEIRHTDSRANTADAMASQASYPPGAPSNAAEPQVLMVDLAAASAGAVRVPDLRDGDVVHVAKRTLRPIYVLGLVRKPGDFAYPTDKEIRVLDALAMAGGCSNPVAENILIIRQVAGAPEPARISVSIQAAKNGRDNLVLAPGDTVSIEQTPATMVVDVVQTFFRVSLGGAISWF
jgi:polysaccharide biosynthesis/export protein